MFNRNFTNEEVKRIREDFAARDVSITELTKELGVAYSTLYGILAGDTYRRAGGPIYVSSLKGRAEWRDTRFARELEEAGISDKEVSQAARYSSTYFRGIITQGGTPARHWVRTFMDMTGATWPRLEDYPEGNRRKPSVQPHWTEEDMEIYEAIWGTEEGSVATAQAKFPDWDIRRLLGPRWMDVPAYYWK